MYQKDNINYLFRLICLLTFIVIIIFTDNIYTLAILAIFVFFLVNLMKNFFISIVILLNFVGFVIGYLTNNLILFKITLIISFIYYFMYNYHEKIVTKSINEKIYNKINERNRNKISRILKEGDIIDNEVIKDKTESDYKEVQDNYQFRFQNSETKDIFTFRDVLYVVFHLSFLFISIMIGSCVI